MQEVIDFEQLPKDRKKRLVELLHDIPKKQQLAKKICDCLNFDEFIYLFEESDACAATLSLYITEYLRINNRSNSFEMRPICFRKFSDKFEIFPSGWKYKPQEEVSEYLKTEQFKNYIPNQSKAMFVNFILDKLEEIRKPLDSFLKSSNSELVGIYSFT